MLFIAGGSLPVKGRGGLALAVLAAAIEAVATGATPTVGARKDAGVSRIDELIAASAKDSNLTPAPLIDDTAYLRRATIDLVGRIPTVEEHRLYFSEPADARRSLLARRLIDSDRFADRWAVWFGDMLRVRCQLNGSGGQPPGGPELDRFLRQSLRDRMPYDELVRRLLTATGQPSRDGAVGYFAQSWAHPLEMMGVVSETLLGIRMKCARCHDDPAGHWTQQEFYEFAAFLGQARLVGSKTTPFQVTEGAQRLAWPPREGGFVSVQPATNFKLTPLEPAWPLPSAAAQDQALAAAISRRPTNKPTDDEVIDELLVDALADVPQAGGLAIEAVAEPKSKYVLRVNFADRLTDPRNRSFARNLVNRLWATLVGRGFVEPVDDFRDDNPPRHPELLDHLANELVASGHDLRYMLTLILASDAYARGHATDEDPQLRRQLEDACLAAPLRPLPPEALHDSIVTAGHVHEVKHPPGANMKTVESIVLAPREASAEAAGGKKGGAMSAVEEARLAALLEGTMQQGDPAMVDLDGAMQAAKPPAGAPAMSPKDSQPNQMAEAMAPGGAATKASTKSLVRNVGLMLVKSQVDQNPHFPWAVEMQLPASPDHFLRMLGQSARLDTDTELRPSMRQALMMINGPLVHEAARVGSLEPLGRALADGGRHDLVGMLYMETLSREPTTEERAGADEVIASAASVADGIADMRWAIFNCREFRFIP
jgi:hypothetical protein